MLGKPLGVGIYSAALQEGQRSTPTATRAMIASTTQLNTPGIALGAMAGVHALTDVTGFGLLGHLLEICRALERRRASSTSARVPLLPARGRARAPRASSPARPAATGRATATTSIWAPSPATPQRALLTDPQTSGGLLVACAPDCRRRRARACSAREGFGEAAVIGEIVAGAPRVAVR